ncbi:MAG TPA: ROK family glucokinase [Gemmatimonadaceae bacterium]|nr:ROK family glucokinase [Gemmatimonadaceae bacterium]
MPPRKRQRYIIGVDLGGTNIVAGAMPEDGSREVAMRSEPTRADQGAEAVVDRIARMIDTVIAETIAETNARREDFAGVGIGSPGPLDRERGIVIVTPNLGWRNFPLRDEISKRVGLPASLDNDANCATLGEWWCGAAKGARHVIGITIGTGIGGGLILDGRLYHGASDVAGEIGHTTIDSTGRRCNCGNYGCLEAYASGPAIAERAREALAGGEPSVLLKMVNDDLKKITAQLVYDAAKKDDDVARQVVRETANFLGAGVANLLNIFNPNVVVIAGGVTQAGAPLFEPLRAEVRRRAFKPAVESCKILPGLLRGSAGVVGAVATFKQQVLDGV